MKHVAGVVLVLGGMAGPALAQEVDCSVAEVQMELTFCAEQDWMAADAGLNDAYKAAVAVMKEIDATLGEGKTAEGYLRQAQRDWVAFRDNACAAEAYPMHGGSAEAMLERARVQSNSPCTPNAFARAIAASGCRVNVRI